MRMAVTRRMAVRMRWFVIMLVVMSMLVVMAMAMVMVMVMRMSLRRGWPIRSRRRPRRRWRHALPRHSPKPLSEG